MLLHDRSPCVSRRVCKLRFPPTCLIGFWRGSSTEAVQLRKKKKKKGEAKRRRRKCVCGCYSRFTHRPPRYGGVARARTGTKFPSGVSVRVGGQLRYNGLPVAWPLGPALCFDPPPTPFRSLLTLQRKRQNLESQR